MTSRVRSELVPQSLIRLCLSAVIVVLGVQHQATAEVTKQDLALPQIEQPALPKPELPQKASSKSITEPTSLVIKLSKRRVYVYRNNQLKTSYPIAVGKAGWETPTGVFKVLQMQRNPAWQHPWNGKIIPPGPDNPLGTRWIGFWTDGENFIGFHGTPQEHLVGQAVSHGCIRMLNKDILALYAQVNVGTPVKVEP